MRETPYPMTAAEGSLGQLYKSHWHHTRLRIKDPKVSVPFYQKHFGMTLASQANVGENSTDYYLTTYKKNDPLPQTQDLEGCQTEAGISSSNRPLQTYLVLHHQHGTEDMKQLKLNNGNEEPHRGFGHIAFNCNDVYAASTKLEAAGVRFRKRPDEGRMKGLAFALDPDGYWIELCGRNKSQMEEEFNLSQTMLRVKDPCRALEFYRDAMGMTLIREMHMTDFSNYFLASLEVPPLTPATSPDARDFVHTLWNPCLELTHNHGTETDPTFHYHNGNEPPVGFCNLGFLVPFDSYEKLHKALTEKYSVVVPPFSATSVKTDTSNSFTIQDPDGYFVTIVQGR